MRFLLEKGEIRLDSLKAVFLLTLAILWFGVFLKALFDGVFGWAVLGAAMGALNYVEFSKKHRKNCK